MRRMDRISKGMRLHDQIILSILFIPVQFPRFSYEMSSSCIVELGMQIEL